MFQQLLSIIDLSKVSIPAPLALAVVAAIGYLIGRKKQYRASIVTSHSKRELQHARKVASELEKITLRIRKNLAKHHSSITRFKHRIGKLADADLDMNWKQLFVEAEDMLKPTLQLATQMADAYDQIRQQSSSLMSITEVRIDPLTNVHNRRTLEDTLRTQFALMGRYGATFSLAIFDIDYFKSINDEQGHLQGDRVLQDVARVLTEYVRETDTVVRYGGDEFIIIMPQTDLDGAGHFMDRLRWNIKDKMSVTISGGVAAAVSGDNQEILLARADAALYKSKTSGRNCIHQHEGTKIVQVATEDIVSTFP
jgi:diguanylate cyclase